MLKILLITGILLIFAFAGLGIKLLFDRNAEFSGGSCSSSSKDQKDKDISCGCGGNCETDNR